jgi:RNA polymerase sigma-54 factor
VEEAAFGAVADFVDSNGFLRTRPEEIANISGIPLCEIKKALCVMKRLEPAGVCSETLEEAILRQLEYAGIDDEILRLLVCFYLDDIANGKFADVAKKLKIGICELRKHIQTIRSLNPRPLNGLLGDVCEYAVPDIIVKYKDKSWEIDLNDNWYENFQVQDYYLKIYHDTDDLELQEFFKNKLARFKFLREAIEKRRETLLNIAERLVFYQSDFFLKKSSLVPLTMNALAKELSVHTSTVSRAIKNKYVQYPGGTCEIRRLFTSGLCREQCGVFVSRNNVKLMLKSLIGMEDKTQPYSDSKLVSLLWIDNISISRRTVAKYREEMGIRGAYERKFN